MSTMNVVFNKLEKFTGSQDFSEWFKNFERCCLIAGKTDPKVQGQLLMLFTDKQPKARSATSGLSKSESSLVTLPRRYKSTYGIKGGAMCR